MVATARDQDALKIANGTRLSGRPCEQPVMTISLAWHPSERARQGTDGRAADSYLKHMGWDEHQAVYVAHNDTAHPHVHIILNRIHPETGRVLNDAFSKNRTQEWARAYEHEHGRIWCEERIGKDYGRADGQRAKAPCPTTLPSTPATRSSATPSSRRRPGPSMRGSGRNSPNTTRTSARPSSKAGISSSARRREGAYREVRAEYKPRWVEHFRDAAAMRERGRTRSRCSCTTCAGVRPPR